MMIKIITLNNEIVTFCNFTYIFHARMVENKEVFIMKEIKKRIFCQLKSSNIIASIALAFAVIAANSPCCCVYHQPQKPDLKALRKF